MFQIGDRFSFLTDSAFKGASLLVPLLLKKYDMNNQNKIKVLFTGILTVLAGLTAFILLQGAENVNMDMKSETLQMKDYRIQTVDLPQKMTFCGEKVPLERVDIREKIDRELMVNAYWHSNSMLMIKRANRYFPIIEPVLKRYGVPEDIKYLAVAESGLDPKIVSPAGATGLWQFMKETGRQYGLEINGEVDERYHVIKSTEAACEYLLSAYEKFGSWSLVAASYNAGRRRILSEMDRQEVTNYFDLLLNSETARYVFRILATKQIMNAPAKYGFHIDKNHLYPLIKCDTVVIKGKISSFGNFAKDHDISYGVLKEFNPWLRQEYLTNKGLKTYRIAIPSKSFFNFDRRLIKVHSKNWVTEN